MADDDYRIGADANQEDVRDHFDSAYATIMHAISDERIHSVYGVKGEKLVRWEETMLSRKEQTSVDCLRSGHHPKL